MPITRYGAADATKLKTIGYVYVDIRAPEEYGKGHPAGAVNVPWQLFDASGNFKANAKFLEVMEALYPKETKLLIIGKIGKRSMAAAEALEAAGYDSIAELRPGVKGLVDDRGRFTEDGWETMGLPSERETEGCSYEELKAKLSGPAAKKEEKKATGDPSGITRLSAPDASKLKSVGYVFLDIRAPEEYGKGHPVGAVNVPWQTFGSGGGFKDNKKFLDVMQALYPKDTKILVIGKIGKRSLKAALALKEAGYTALVEMRPGMKGLVDDRGRFTEDGWETMGLPMEKTTEDGSYKELKERAGI